MKAEEYIYKLPEDYVIKSETREKLDKLVHQLGLSNEQAQEFVDIHVELMEEYAAELAASTGQPSTLKTSYAPEGAADESDTKISQTSRAKYSKKI